MKSHYKRLGDYIQLIDVRNREMAVTRLLGININKEFMPSVANVSNTDLSRYKVINKGVFACNVMHVGRDERIPIAFYTDDEPAIISPAYFMFTIVGDELLPEFLMMHLQRPEFDRYAGYICDSSIRGGLEWERFCDIQIPIPDIEEQRKYVAVYKALQKNQQAYEKSLDDLQLVCDTFLENLKKLPDKERIGQYFTLVDNRNNDSTVERLLGINVLKEFMPSKANIGSTDLSKYKVIRRGQFAYSAMQVGRDETVRVALYTEEEPAIISPAYLTFGVAANSRVLPEYFMIWFRRPEFNRFGWFLSDSSVRASLEWDRFCDIRISIPKIEVQESIVAIHHTLETRKRLNNELKTQIQNLCPILMRGVVENLSESVA
jgi:type I restriction enzyme, S subunit